MCPIFQAAASWLCRRDQQIGTGVVKTITQPIIQTVHEKLQTYFPWLDFPCNDQKYGGEHWFLFFQVTYKIHTGAKILNLSKNSHFPNLIFHTIHIFKISVFSKFTYSKSHFSQNSPFQSVSFHKIHIFQTSNSW